MHNFFRGGPVATYEGETLDALDALEGEIDTAAARDVWDAARAARWSGDPVWVHGDVFHTNLLVDAEGRLSAVIDFGCAAVGDPACDLTFAWTFLSGDSREAFREGLALDDETWARARGWALWKAAIKLASRAVGPREPALHLRVIADVLGEHASLR